MLLHQFSSSIDHPEDGGDNIPAQEHEINPDYEFERIEVEDTAHDLIRIEKKQWGQALFNRSPFLVLEFLHMDIEAQRKVHVGAHREESKP
ncbi:hypothetical protein B9Z55_007850 [Caenorhabditis nigoni]|uniref:Uncharacterized protein n=1 Tax=Caenorhabditis nigoni TaxID=1611254 RepID=A0A2G5VBN4_9PELO|nr:hypothetical protein B9Z55_007850 [Caenorhabditis nigoni]